MVTRYALSHLTGEKTDDHRAAHPTRFGRVDRAGPPTSTERTRGSAHTATSSPTARARRRARVPGRGSLQLWMEEVPGVFGPDPDRDVDLPRGRWGGAVHRHSARRRLRGAHRYG